MTAVPEVALWESRGDTEASDGKCPLATCEFGLLTGCVVLKTTVATA